MTLQLNGRKRHGVTGRVTRRAAHGITGHGAGKVDRKGTRGARHGKGIAVKRAREWDTGAIGRGYGAGQC